MTYSCFEGLCSLGQLGDHLNLEIQEIVQVPNNHGNSLVPTIDFDVIHPQPVQGLSCQILRCTAYQKLTAVLMAEYSQIGTVAHHTEYDYC